MLLLYYLPVLSPFTHMIFLINVVMLLYDTYEDKHVSLNISIKIVYCAAYHCFNNYETCNDVEKINPAVNKWINY